MMLQPMYLLGVGLGWSICRRVVPTRFGISASENQREQFEGSNLDADNDGNKDGIEYDFTITREKFRTRLI